MELKDLISSGIAALALLATVALGVWTNRRNASASRRQEALVEAQHETNSRLAELVARLAESGGSVQSGAGSVYAPWLAEQVAKKTWLIRNLGGTVAKGVDVDRAGVGGVRVDIAPALPADIGPGESFRITATGSWGNPVADEMKVSWGKGQSAVVPLPRWL